MKKYILSALVLPVALMSATAAQAKTPALRAKVNPVNASAKNVSGTTIRGAHVKVTRGKVTYGVTKANRHGHFMLKLNHKIKGGWKFKLTISKAGYKTKLVGFKARALTKKTTKIKPVVPTSPASTAPAVPAAPKAPTTQSSAPKPTTVGSQADVEAGRVSNDIARLNLQLDNFQAGRQTMTPFWRTSVESQVQQLLNRINGLATGNLRTDLLNTLRNAWTNLHQRFLNFVAGLNRQVFGGNTSTRNAATTPSVTKKAPQPKPFSVAEKIKALQDSSRKNNEIASDLDVSIHTMSQNLKTDNFSDHSRQQIERLQALNQAVQKSAFEYEEVQRFAPYLSEYLNNDSLALMKQRAESLKTDYEQLLQSEHLDKENYEHILENVKSSRDKAREQVLQNNAQIQILQDLQKQASQTK